MYKVLEVLIATMLKIQVCWNVTSRPLVNGYERLDGA